MTTITNDDLSKYIANRLQIISAKDIEIAIFRPHRPSNFELEIMKASEELLIKKLKEEY